jgi:HD-GYP domain-containing protein (c-di-GMP phosphodiesterase class II)
VSTVLALPASGALARLPPRLRLQMERSAIATVRALAATLELREPAIARRQRRVATLAVGIGKQLGLATSRLRGLELAAAVYDIGMLGVPVDLLGRARIATAAEHERVRSHAGAGASILGHAEFPWPLREIVWQHHERVDGSGYPRSLKGAQILPEARILAVADVVEAMASERPYRAASGTPAALAEIEAGRGVRYDADAADACLRLFHDFGYQVKQA